MSDRIPLAGRPMWTLPSRLIETLERRTLLATFVVTNTADDGPGSLRDAINQANVSAIDETILFNIGGKGVHTIKPLSQLPAIQTGIDIQGTTDASGNPLIELDGENAGANAVGLNLMRNTPGYEVPSQISGLIINRFGGNGMNVMGNAPAEVFGCRIGTDATGKLSRPNGADGINVTAANSRIGLPFPGPAYQNVISGNDLYGVNISSASATGVIIQNCLIGTDRDGKFAIGNRVGMESMSAHTQVGGSRPNQGNVVSGNAVVGIDLSAANNLVVGNFIGTDVTGTVAIPNLDIGLYLGQGADGTRVGDSSDNPGALNVISGNQVGGILITESNGISILRNFIGTDVTGLKPLANDDYGIFVEFSSNNRIDGAVISGNLSTGIELTAKTQDTRIINCEIGTDETGKIALPNVGDGIFMSDRTTGTTITGNTIAHNGENGINVKHETSVGNRIISNRIFSNGKLGINLGGDDAPLPNHSGVVAGPDHNQNYPVLTSAVVSGKTRVIGTLASTPNTVFTIEIYTNDSADPSGFGEGQRMVASTSVMTDGNGNVPFDLQFAALGFGQRLSATATSLAGDTSEFSQDIVVQGASIIGTVINDANANGKADSGETGLSGRTVYADLDMDGRLSSGDISTKTNAKGNYRLFGVPTGEVRVRLAGTAGWKQTFPSSKAAYRDVNVTALGTSKGIGFGQAKATAPSAVLAINAGGSGYVDLSGQPFAADNGFIGGTTTNTAFDVAGTDEDPLYYSYRYGASFGYSFNVPNGDYTLKLLFVDPLSVGPAQRTFNVVANGTTVLKDFDLFAAAGALKAFTRTFAVHVNNRKLTLGFTGTTGNAIVSAIELFDA